jgi:hypothetical protein
VGAIFIEGPHRRTHFWKRTIHWLFHQHLVLIEKNLLWNYSTKLCWNDPLVVPFQNCVRHFIPPSKMAATAELNLT